MGVIHTQHPEVQFSGHAAGPQALPSPHAQVKFFVGAESVQPGSQFQRHTDLIRREAAFGIRTENVLALSRRLGAEYVLMLGEQVDSRTLRHPIEVLDYAILPAFVMPSRKVKIEAKLSGAFISVESGHVVFLVNAVCDKSLLAGYVKQQACIDYRTVGTAIRELEGDIQV